MDKSGNTAKALFQWIKHREKKGEYVSCPILVVKCKKYEKALNVSENKSLIIKVYYEETKTKLFLDMAWKSFIDTKNLDL